MLQAGRLLVAWRPGFALASCWAPQSAWARIAAAQRCCYSRGAGLPLLLLLLVQCWQGTHLCDADPWGPCSSPVPNSQ